MPQEDPLRTDFVPSTQAEATGGLRGVDMESPLPTADEVLAVLANIEDGRLTVIPVRGADGEIEYAGDHPYLVSNGWTIVVFVDCASFDYVDDVLLPDGTALGIWSHMGAYAGLGPNDPDPTNGYERVRSYRPPQEVEGRVYGIREP